MGIMGNELRVMERSIERSKWRRLKKVGSRPGRETLGAWEPWSA